MAPVYATAAELRAHLSLTSGELGDADANRLLEDAEDAIDVLLVARTVDATTGRKVVEADVDAWRWAKVKRATLLAAARLYGDPGLLTNVVYASTSGPDFAQSGRVGAGGMADRLGPVVVGVLQASGLRRTELRARPGYAFGLNQEGFPYDPDLDETDDTESRA